MGKDTNSFSESFSLEDLEEIGIGLAGAKKEPVREANGCERSSPPTPEPSEVKDAKAEEFSAEDKKVLEEFKAEAKEPETVDEVLEQDFPTPKVEPVVEVKRKKKLTLPKDEAKEIADSPAVDGARSNESNKVEEVVTPAVKLSLAGKLQALRYEINRLGLKMHGKGAGAFSFDYFELADFLPQATELMHKLGLATAFNMSETIASLTLLDTESDKELLFTVPVSTVNVLARGSAAQNIGAAMTFARRYLYLALLDLSEVDTAVDAEVPAVNTGGKAVKETPRVDLEVKQPKGTPVFNLDDL